MDDEKIGAIERCKSQNVLLRLHLIDQPSLCANGPGGRQKE